jgi:hypothetical protein
MCIRIAAVLGLVLVVALPASAQTWGDVAERLRSRDLVLRPADGRRKVYLESGDAEAYALFDGTRLFPLRAAEPVKVVNVSPKNDHVEIQLNSTRLGRGRVDFYGAPPSPMPSRRGELHRVVHEVDHDLLDALGIDPDQREIIQRMDCKIHAQPLGLWAEPFGCGHDV